MTVHRSSFRWRGGEPRQRHIDDILQRLAAGAAPGHHVHALHDRYPQAAAIAIKPLPGENTTVASSRTGW
ncbi:MAG TPA: hypothetical protein VF070_33985 [Streptosporangiaceae bacterium]